MLTPAESDSHYMMLANGVNDDLSGKRTFDVNSPSNIIASDPNGRQLVQEDSIERRKMNIISGVNEDEGNPIVAPDVTGGGGH